MRKGFTLLELLGIIILLGVIILVAVPSLIQSNKNAEINDQKEFNNAVNNACISYIQVHSDEYNDLLNTSGTSKTIETETLTKEGYLKSTLKNPNSKTNIEEENSQIIAKNSNGQITCEYRLQ